MTEKPFYLSVVHNICKFTICISCLFSQVICMELLIPLRQKKANSQHTCGCSEPFDVVQWRYRQFVKPKCWPCACRCSVCLPGPHTSPGQNPLLRLCVNFRLMLSGCDHLLVLMGKFSLGAYSWAWKAKPADVPKAEQPAGRGLQTQDQFRGWPEQHLVPTCNMERPAPGNK